MSFFDEGGVLRHDPRPIRKRRTWFVLIVFILLAVAAYVGAHRFADDRVPFGTSVEGVPVGGLTRAEALNRLRNRLGARLETPVTVTRNDRTFHLNAAKSGFRIDYAATLRAVGAAKERWTPRDVWRFYTHGGDYDAVFRVDKARFSKALFRLTNKIGRAAVEGTVAFRNGHARPVYGRTGLAIDETAAIRLVESLVFARHAGELPMATHRPYVSAHAVQAAMKQFGRPAMSGPVTVDIGGHRFTIPPSRFGKALKMVPSDGKLVPLIDGGFLHKVLAPAMPTIGDKPKDATVRLRRGVPHVRPAVFGAAYDDDALAHAFVKALTKAGDARVARVHAAITDPDVTTADARGWGISKKAAEAVVKAPLSAMRPLDQLVLAPSHEVKMSDVLDSPGTKAVSGVFAAALRAGLDIPSFTAPDRPDHALPRGRQATDLTIKGGSGHWLLTVRRLGSKRSVLTVWGASNPDVHISASKRTKKVPAPVHTSSEDDCTPRQGKRGFTITVTRVGPGTPSKFVSTYEPVARIRCTGSSQTASP